MYKYLISNKKNEINVHKRAVNDFNECLKQRDWVLIGFDTDFKDIQLPLMNISEQFMKKYVVL